MLAGVTIQLPAVQAKQRIFTPSVRQSSPAVGSNATLKETSRTAQAPKLCDPAGFKPGNGQPLLYLYVWSGRVPPENHAREAKNGCWLPELEQNDGSLDSPEHHC